MKVINYKDYKGDGVLIDLDKEFVPYQNLLNNHYKYLNKNTKYYFYCRGGHKSKKVALILEAYGYDTSIVFK